MKRIASILLSFILLASHINLAIATHFCDNEVVMTKLVIGHQHLSCGMANMDEFCGDSENRDLRFNSPTCCENHYQIVETTDDFVQDAQKLNINIEFIAALFYTYIKLDVDSQTDNHFYADDAAPPLIQDKQILFQTFII